jgi:uncharacterized protein
MGITVDKQYHPDLEVAVRRLVDFFQPERIYLFGSRARGDAREDSDYDVLVVVPQSTLSYLDRIRAGSRLTRDLTVEIQTVVLTTVEFEQDIPIVASLPSRANREGRLLYAA